jgi:predicted homoserine dehydrogenase-like protein
MLRPVSKGKLLTYADVSLDETSLAFALRKEMEQSLP